MSDEIRMTLDDKELTDYIKRIEARGRNPKDMFFQISAILKKSILYNFKAGGRPNHWRALTAWTTAVKRTTKRAVGNFKDILFWEGKLRASIGIQELDSKHLAFGTNDHRAAILQYGRPAQRITAKGRALAIPVDAAMFKEIQGGKPKTKEPVIFRKSANLGEIPPRPFILFQDEDIKRIMSYAHAWAFSDKEPK